MEEGGDASRSTRPVPTCWPDNSEEDMQNKANNDAMGGGWDTGSDEDAAAGGGGMREFERSSAENTRRALMENDAEICQPPGPEEFDCSGSDGSADDGREKRRRALRYVPGDPFASEKADTDAWARHFTYLSIFPSKSLSSRSVPGERGNRGVDHDAVRAGFEGPEGVSLKGTIAGNGVEDEVVLASHGIYEEYLAYDCRPPEEENEEVFMKEATNDPCATEPQRCSNKPRVTVRLSTPQRALREEIMDRLFDKLWEHLTPDLLNLVDKTGSKERRGPVLTANEPPEVVQSDSSKFEISGAGLQAGIVAKDMEL